MSLYDIIMLVVFGGAILFGYWKGLAWQIASIAAIIASYFVSINFRDPVSRFITTAEPWNRIGAMLILFLGTSFAIWTVYAFVSKSLKKMEMKGFDRQAGALLGAFKGALLCMIITMFSVSLLGAKAFEAIHQSKTGSYVVWGIHQVSAIVPNELKPFVEPHVNKFNQSIGADSQFNQYPAGEQGRQDPNQVQRFYGQWQLPSTTVPNRNLGTAGYQNQPTNPPAQNNTGFSGIWGNQQTGNQQYQNQQTGSPNNTGNPGTIASSPNSNGGWPDINYRVNSKELLDAATKATTDAARKAFERPNQR